MEFDDASPRYSDQDCGVITVNRAGARARGFTAGCAHAQYRVIDNVKVFRVQVLNVTRAKVIAIASYDPLSK